MLPIGAVSPVIGDAIFRTDSVVVPVFTENGDVMTRANRNQAHIEQVLYRERRAWYVSINELREAQRDHAQRRWKRPRVDRCLELIQEAAMLLMYQVPPRQDPSKRLATDDPVEAKAKAAAGEDQVPVMAYQWGQRWLREELVRLRVNAALWLVENASFQVERAVVPIDIRHVWREAALSSWELWFPPRTEGLIPVLMLHGDGVDITVPLPEFGSDCENVRMIRSVRNSRFAELENRNELTHRIERCIAKLWGYLPQQPALLTHGVGFQSYAYPHEEHMERNPEGGNVCEAWQRDHIRKQQATEGAEKRRQKKRKSSKIHVSDMVIDDDEDLFD